MSFLNAPVDYNPQWPELYKKHAAELMSAASEAILRIDHVGSTSILGMKAKPILDIMVTFKKGSASELVSGFEKLNYNYKGEMGIVGRTYFSRPASEHGLAVHVHCFEEGFSEIKKHLAFVNYLRVHPEVAQAYLQLKNQILAQPEVTRESYQNSKNDFISEVTKKALAWAADRDVYEKIISKVVIYVVRETSGFPEVLVFDHVKYPEVSPQVPAGTVEPGENLTVAARRELSEEAGVSRLKEFKFLGSYVFYKDSSQQFQERNFFVVRDNSLADGWIHSVTGSGVDKDLEFRYYWLPFDTAIVDLKADYGAGIALYLTKKG